MCLRKIRSVCEYLDKRLSTSSLERWLPRPREVFLFIYLFLAELGLCCWARAFSSCSEQGLLFVVVHGLLIAVASLVERGL